MYSRVPISFPQTIISTSNYLSKGQTLKVIITINISLENMLEIKNIVRNLFYEVYTYCMSTCKT